MKLLAGIILNRYIIVDFGAKHEPTTTPIRILSPLVEVPRQGLAILTSSSADIPNIASY